MLNQKTAARLSILASLLTLLLLAALHILSSEFNPAWRMVSEYANGNYTLVLSLFFAIWGISTWALAYAIWSEPKTKAGRIGLYFLIAAGVGEVMASVFDINHSLHSLASLIGIPSLAIAAVLISKSLSKEEAWFSVNKNLLLTANLTWISILLMAVSFVILIATFTQSGAEMPTDSTTVTALPAGVIGLVGWANRFLIIVYNVWVIFVARHSIKVNEKL
ncbi:MAG: DUF998 domain-containing protein [Anaerolineales bacterium]|nr:DUF998 domain-containing protein [Anaerolineales bacterium]